MLITCLQTSKLYRLTRLGGGLEDFFGVMYYIGEINTGVPPGLGGGTFAFLGGCINPCKLLPKLQETFY